MTDPSSSSGQICYVCGHPILEGQPRSEPRDRWKFDKSFKRVLDKREFSHFNPADHLPTLHPLLAEDLSKQEVKLAVDYWREKERERAAAWVEKARDECQSDTHIQIFDMLIQRIRSGE